MRSAREPDQKKPARAGARRRALPGGDRPSALPHGTLMRSARKARAGVGALLFAAAGIGLGAVFGAADAAPEAGLAEGPKAEVFDLYFGGFPIGDVRLALEMDGDRYSAAAKGEASGLISAIVGGRFSATASGAAPGGDPLAPGASPALFEAEGSFADDSMELSIAFDGGDVTDVTAVPPYKSRPWEAEARAWQGAVDPLTAIALMLRERPGGALCDAAMEIFDGRRVVRAQLGAPEKVAKTDEVKCSGVIERKAGFKPKMMKKPPMEFRVYFGPRDGGLALKRVMVPTDWGVATAVRRGS
ncbi:hypothetical protein ACQ5SO_14855 [Rhodovulum sp. DZ06]|uniref:hypothetical protein n=1 Tax=Rhodovulum sp. DZ06 TaxID=3425126 RepID=UPI003D3288BB